MASVRSLCEKMGHVTIVCKGENDIISDGIQGRLLSSLSWSHDSSRIQILGYILVKSSNNTCVLPIF